jgi:hypothetical protein
MLKINSNLRNVAAVTACLAVTVMFASCTKNSEVFNDKVDVYVAGYEASGQEYSMYYGTEYRSVAKLWKNGVAQNLTDGTRDAIATSVFVSGDDVYIAGYEATGQEYSDGLGNQHHYYVAKLWKNGVAQNLTDGTINTHTYAYSVFVSGNDVYVAGSTGNSAILWKNGVADTLFSAFYGAFANSVFVSDDDVYVAGYISTFTSMHAGSTLESAKFLKNGVMQDISDGYRGASGVVNSIFVSNGDVYLAGTDTYYVAPKFWKNNVAEYLSDGYGANSVFVADRDVYVAGRGSGKAILWKNSVAQNLADGTANSVFVSGKDVYVAGSDDVKAIVWKNGIAQNLTDGKRDAGANSIFVVESEQTQ